MTGPWEKYQPTNQFDAALAAEGVSGRLADVARSIYQQESGSGSNTRTSNAGAVGGMQIIPATFARVADKDWNINNPEQNLRAGIRYLKTLEPLAGGDPKLIAAGYYGGEGAIPKAAQGVAISDPRNPKAPNTLQYGDQVASRLKQESAGSPWEKYQKQEDFSDVSAGVAQAPEPSLADRALRAAGIGARGVVKGVAAIPTLMADIAAVPLRAATGGKYFRSPSSVLDETLTATGLPQPANAYERVGQDIAGGLGGAGAMIGAGNVMANAAGPVVSGIGRMLASQPALQGVGAVTGSAASGATREAGGGPLAQAAAGIAGGMVPSLARSVVPEAAKNLFRGPEGRQGVANNVKLFEEAGYGAPTVGQATESRFSRGVENTLGRTPGGAGKIVEAGEKGAANLGAKVASLADDLSPSSSTASAGAAIEKGVKDFSGRFKAEQKFLYDKLDSHIPANTSISVPNTRAALADLNADIPGAPALSQWFKNSKIVGIDKALESDLSSSSNAAMTPSQIKSATQSGNLPNGGLPYEAIKKLRTLVGDELSNTTLISDIPRSKWRALYGALSSDLEAAAAKAGPNAEKSFSRANQFSSAGYDRIGTYLDRVAGKDTVEKIFLAATSPSELKHGASTINAVMRSLEPAERKVVQSAFLRRMGDAVASQQGAEGGKFSTQTFLTNWSNMSPQAKMTLFAGKDGELRQSLDQIAKVAGNVREGSKIFANPSGTAQASSAGFALGAFFLSLVTGNMTSAAGIAGTAGAANLSSRLMTNPDFVKWLAKTTVQPTSAAPSALNNLSQIAARMSPSDKAAAHEFIQKSKESLGQEKPKAGRQLQELQSTIENLR